ncbi:unnamed protein product [Laminaria digitata]
MFERMMNFFETLGGPDTGEKGPDTSDLRVAAAALLFHLMDADGERRIEESSQITDALKKAYGLDGDELEKVLAAGEEADRDAVDLYAFTSVINRELDEEAKLEFVEIMWEIVLADHELHELEDNTVWRVAELIGVSNRDRINLRSKVAERRGVKLNFGDD